MWHIVRRPSHCDPVRGFLAHPLFPVPTHRSNPAVERNLQFVKQRYILRTILHQGCCQRTCFEHLVVAAALRRKEAQTSFLDADPVVHDRHRLPWRDICLEAAGQSHDEAGMTPGPGRAAYSDLEELQVIYIGESNTKQVEEGVGVVPDVKEELHNLSQYSLREFWETTYTFLMEGLWRMDLRLCPLAPIVSNALARRRTTSTSQIVSLSEALSCMIHRLPERQSATPSKSTARDVVLARAARQWCKRGWVSTMTIFVVEDMTVLGVSR